MLFHPFICHADTVEPTGPNDQAGTRLDIAEITANQGAITYQHHVRMILRSSCRPETRCRISRQKECLKPDIPQACSGSFERPSALYCWSGHLLSPLLMFSSRFAACAGMPKCHCNLFFYGHCRNRGRRSGIWPKHSQG